MASRSHIPLNSVTICIPTLNRANSIAACISSALAQDWQNIKVLVVDNGSTDETREILAEFSDPRLQIELFDSTVEMYANHNRCIQLASSDYVLFLHSDETITCKDAVRKLVFAIQAHQCDAVIRLKSFIENINSCETLSGDSGWRRYILQFSGISPSGCLYKTSYMKHRPYATDNLSADWVYLLDMLESGKSVYLAKDDYINDWSFSTGRTVNTYVRSLRFYRDKAAYVSQHSEKCIDVFVSAMRSGDNIKTQAIEHFLMALLVVDRWSLMRRPVLLVLALKAGLVPALKILVACLLGVSLYLQTLKALKPSSSLPIGPGE